jgi:[acyl-carrier-protein] S-malonyltransferase
MMPAQDRLAADLAKLQYGSYRFQVVHNVDALPRFESSAAFDALTRQVSSPVLWSPSVEWLIAHGVDTFVEVGPGKVLTGLVKQINRDVRTFNISDTQSLRSTLETI